MRNNPPRELETRIEKGEGHVSALRLVEWGDNLVGGGSLLCIWYRGYDGIAGKAWLLLPMKPRAEHDLC